MIRKMWLVRDENGDYAICRYKPKDASEYLSFGSHPYPLLKNLCSENAKKWLELKKHLKNETCIQGWFDVRFKPLKQKERSK